MVVRNLIWVRKKWERLMRVLGREGANARKLCMFYVAVVYMDLLYGLETWVMFLNIGRDLVSFYHRFSCRLTGRKPRREMDDEWVYPPLAEAMAEVVLQDVET